VEAKWLEWAQKLQAIAQNGLTYSQGLDDIERHKQLRAIATEVDGFPGIKQVALGFLPTLRSKDFFAP
jgi:Hydrolase of X-linked nucleoside diphosphate N terminal